MELADLLDFEKITKNISIHSPLFVYIWLLYKNPNSRFFIVMVVVSLILSVWSIVSADYYRAKLNVKKGEAVYSDDKRLVEGLGRSNAIITSINALSTYLMIVNAGFATFFIIGFMIAKGISITSLVLAIMSASFFGYSLFKIIFHMKANLQLTRNIRALRTQPNQSKPSVKPKRKSKSR